MPEKCKRRKIEPSKKVRFIVQNKNVQGILRSSSILINLAFFSEEKGYLFIIMNILNLEFTCFPFSYFESVSNF